MTQTALLPGRDHPDDLVGDVSRGLYVSDISWGRMTPETGAFQLMVRQGRVIRDGRLAEPVVGGAIAGESVSALKAIVGVARDLEWSGGMCVKRGQPVPVSTGGPTTLLATADVRG